MFGEILKTALIFFVAFKGVSSLRDVRLIVNPPDVVRNGTAALICSRDMQGAPLYSVKWYRGNHEFYRYTPMENPNTRLFGLPGAYVDMNLSNGSQVLLRRLNLSLAGNFSCEVTADSPSFSTQIATKYIDIITLPNQDPVLKADKDQYQPSEVLRANCSSSPARPAANVTIFINERAYPSSKSSLHPSDSGFYWSSAAVELKVSPDLFPGGRLRVACVATVYGVFRRSAALDFFTPDTDPRPERITFNAASKGAFSWLLILLLSLLPLLSTGLPIDEQGLLGDSLDYYDDSLKEPIASMLGG